MKEEQKILEKGESTYRNGDDGDYGDGCFCGGVMSKTEFFKDVEANMKAYYMEDENFALYKRLKESGGSADRKAARDLFKQCAKSFI